MNHDNISQYRQAFEAAAHAEQGVEFWFARDLQRLFEYTQWRNFLAVVQKAMEACKNSHQDAEDHFAGVSKMVQLGKVGKEKLSLVIQAYAC